MKHKKLLGEKHILFLPFTPHGKLPSEQRGRSNKLSPWQMVRAKQVAVILQVKCEYKTSPCKN